MMDATERRCERQEASIGGRVILRSTWRCCGRSVMNERLGSWRRGGSSAPWNQMVEEMYHKEIKGDPGACLGPLWGTPLALRALGPSAAAGPACLLPVFYVWRPQPRNLYVTTTA